MDGFDSQSFLQLAQTIPDNAALGLSLPLSSIAPDQGLGLPTDQPSGPNPTSPEDLAAAAGSAFQHKAFLLAAANVPDRAAAGWRPVETSAAPSRRAFAGRPG